MKKPKSFIFIGDIIKTNIKEPIEIIPNYFLKKAESKQIDLIKEQLINLPFSGAQFIQYENVGKPIRTKLNRENWNYWIIEYNEITFNKNLLYAIFLAEVDLNIFFEIKVSSMLSPKKEIKKYHFNPLFYLPSPLSMFLFYFDNLFITESTKITLNNITEIKNIFSIKKKFDKAKDEYDFINNALFDFMMLKTISKKSPFRLVAILSTLEMLLTHQPENIDGDSLSRQLRTKINLLNNRFEQNIDMSKYFSSQINIETIINKIYKYRSKIVHGSEQSYNKIQYLNLSEVKFEGELQILGNRENVYKFTYNLLKKVIIQALIEPQLIEDLKAC